MPADQRTEQELRREIATEREQLVQAVAGLREGVYEQRRLAAAAGAVVAAGFVAAATFAVVRRLKG